MSWCAEHGRPIRTSVADPDLAGVASLARSQGSWEQVFCQASSKTYGSTETQDYVGQGRLEEREEPVRQARATPQRETDTSSSCSQKSLSSFSWSSRRPKTRNTASCWISSCSGQVAPLKASQCAQGLDHVVSSLLCCGVQATLAMLILLVLELPMSCRCCDLTYGGRQSPASTAAGIYRGRELCHMCGACAWPGLRPSLSGC